MSSHAFYEADPPADDVARGLNSDFQFIADRLPTEIKEAPPADVFTLCCLENIGALWARYYGQRPDPTGQAISQYMVQIGMQVETDDTRLRLAKEYALTYQTLHQQGPLNELEPLRGEDLLGCPAPLEVLAFAARSLREEFARVHKEYTEAAAEVIQLDIYRDI